MKLNPWYLTIVLGITLSAVYGQSPARNLDEQKTLYVVGYSHLDTQWRWDYVDSIDKYIKNTLDQSFPLFETYKDYVFSFTGSRRYEMMKDYYPDHYEKVKKLIADGRWFVSGSSVDECDVLIPSPESVLRQILYGNQYFRQEFGKESSDFILPDCFGFPSYLPSLWAHTGLLGFSTQKLTWGSAVGIPFNVGVWEGPDGKSVIAALNAESYTGTIKERQDTSEKWLKRIEENGLLSGVFADYRYYGVGDQGGAPRESDVKMAQASLHNPDAKLNVVLASSDQMYKDITPAQRERLPRYAGELMLTEHSSGSMTSQAYMKRWNRKNEQLADAAERASILSAWLGASDYPQQQLTRLWWSVLGSQMHDIMPGTCIPKGYEYSWNDEIIAANGFAAALTGAMGGISRALDTQVKGQALVVYNPLSMAREDVVEATVNFGKEMPAAVSVFDSEGKETAAQVLEKRADGLRIAFVAKMPAVSVAVFDVRSGAATKSSELKVSTTELENSYYKVTINGDGDIAGIYDKQAKREMLSAPARLEFHRDRPANWPAWNMDWKDRQLPAQGFVQGPAAVRIVENGPVRVALEVKREANHSIFTQRICLSAGQGGNRVEVVNHVDWQSVECALKASFPLTVANPMATYTQGLGTIQRPNNNPKQYEMLSHEWLDLTDSSGAYGVSVLEDCKYGSDKPADNIVRLTLLRSPGVRGSYREQSTQDWGSHDFVYALYGHAGTWQDGNSEYQGRRLNQPLRSFQVAAHPGTMGRQISMLSVNTTQVDVRAIKKAEDSKRIIVRLQELQGKPAQSVLLTLGQAITGGYEVDGQERQIGPATIVDGKLKLDMSKYAIRSFALEVAKVARPLDKAVSTPVELAYNAGGFSGNDQASQGGFGSDKKTIPAEMMPAKLIDNGVQFVMGSTQADQKNMMVCQGQTIKLPAGQFKGVHILAAADADTTAMITIGQESRPLAVQCWTGYIGQYDNRLWDGEDYDSGILAGIQKGYIKRDNLAWFCSHRHTVEGKNESYQFSYLFNYGFALNGKTDSITLPDNPAIKVFAISLVSEFNTTKPATDLYDNFDNRPEIKLRWVPGSFTIDRKPLGKVTSQRAESYAELALAKPATDDFGTNVDFLPVETNGMIKPLAAIIDGKLIRLNDGLVGQNNDDLTKCTFYDGGDCRFMADLKKPVTINTVNTYSWHRTNRAPQKFTLWASKEKLSPQIDILSKDNGWSYIGRVDTGKLGRGGVHVSSVEFPADQSYQYLLWVCDDAGEGTFFNEIDIVVK